MHSSSRLMLPLAISLVSIQACSAMDQKSSDTQPPAQTAVSIPVTVPPKAEAPAPAAAAPAAVAPSPQPAQVKTGKPPMLVDHYKVELDDTLTHIAAKREVYGDARLWPLLYRANVNQIGPGGLIFPDQVLVVDRNYAPEEIIALTGGPQKPAAPAPAAAAPAASQAPVAPATPSAATSAQPTPAAPGVASVSTVSQTIKLSDYLRGAREAFAAGDSPWAIYYYSVYLQQQVTDIDVWGELGNVYYLEGEYAKAAKAYFNVANLLIDRGQTARALELMPVIEEGDAGLSAAIYQRLTTVKQ